MGRAKATLPLDDGRHVSHAHRAHVSRRGRGRRVVVVGHDADAIVRVFGERSAGALRRQPRLRPRTAVVACRGTRRGRSAGRVGHARDAGRRAAGVRGHGPRSDRRATAARTRRSCGRPSGSAARPSVARSIDRCSPRCAPPIRPTGAKPIVRAHASAAGDIAIDDEGAFTDIDTEEDYRRMISDRSSGGAGSPRQSREKV